MMRYKKLKNFADSQANFINKSGSFPIKRANRKIVVFPVVNSKSFFEILKIAKYMRSIGTLCPGTPPSLNFCSFSAYPLLALFPLRYVDLGEYAGCVICFLTIQVFSHIVSAGNI